MRQLSRADRRGFRCSGWATEMVLGERPELSARCAALVSDDLPHVQNAACCAGAARWGTLLLCNQPTPDLRTLCHHCEESPDAAMPVSGEGTKRTKWGAGTPLTPGAGSGGGTERVNARADLQIFRPQRQATKARLRTVRTRNCKGQSHSRLAYHYPADRAAKRWPAAAQQPFSLRRVAAPTLASLCIRI